MREAVAVSILRHEQRDPAAWDRAARFAREWNAAEGTRFAEVLGQVWKIEVPDAASAEHARLREGLEALRAAGVAYRLSTRTVFEEEDFRSADFVHLLGVGLEEEGPGALIVNEDEALAPLEPCGACGWTDAFNRRQVGPFEVREEVLAGPAYPGEAAPAGGWDLVNAPNGHLLVSRRVLQLLEDVEAEGFQVAEVLAHPRRAVSERLFQLLADVVVTHPCPTHSGVAEESVCRVCGAHHAPSPPVFRAPAAEVGGLDLFARHPSRGAHLYFSGRLYRAFLEAGLNGVFPQDVAVVCEP